MLAGTLAIAAPSSAVWGCYIDAATLACRRQAWDQFVSTGSEVVACVQHVLHSIVSLSVLNVVSGRCR